MNKVLLKEVPRKCPKCDVYIFTEAPRPKIGREAWLIVAAGVLATALWCALIFTFSEFYVKPGGPGGFIVIAFVYGWPFYVAAVAAWKLPMEVSSKCFKCGDKKQFKIRLPKM